MADRTATDASATADIGETFLLYCKYAKAGTEALEGAGKVVQGIVGFVKSLLEEECYLCGTKMKGNALKEHVLKNHSVDTCFLCEESVSREHLRAHVIGHKFVSCWECSEQVLIEDLCDHFKWHKLQDRYGEQSNGGAAVDTMIKIFCMDCKTDVPATLYNYHTTQHKHHQKEEPIRAPRTMREQDLEKKNQ